MLQGNFIKKNLKFPKILFKRNLHTLTTTKINTYICQTIYNTKALEIMNSFLIYIHSVSISFGVINRNVCFLV